MNSIEKSSGPRIFVEAEKEFAKLKDRFEAGTLSEADLKARLQDLMVQDAQGRWWVIGYETGRWYVRVGEEWIQRRPPQETKADLPMQDRSRAAPSLWEAVWWPAVLIAIGFAFSKAFVTNLVYGFSFDSEFLRYSVFGLIVQNAIFGILSGLITGMIIRTFYPLFQSKYLYVIALGWAIVFALMSLTRM